MKSFVLERLDRYTINLEKNIELFEDDGNTVEAIDLDFDSLLDTFLQKLDEDTSSEANSYKISFGTLKGDSGTAEAENLIDQNRVKDGDLIKLFSALSVNTSFQGRIIVCNQAITDSSAIKLASIIKENAVNIKQINISHNRNLKKETGICLGEALRYNTTIRSLLLAGNSLGTEGANRIIEALRFNSTITELDLGIITDESLQYLIKFIKENSTLNHLLIQEDPENSWIKSTKEQFVKATRPIENLLSIDVIVLDLLAEQKFLGLIAEICEFNRNKYVQGLEHENNLLDSNANNYYSTEFDFINSGVFSIKSYVSNIFGSLLEESLYKIEKDRFDLLRNRKWASIMGQEPENKNSHILTADGSIFELAKELFKNLEKEDS